jgi:hypothetical protein
MAGFSVHYLIIDELYGETVYKMLISYVCNEIRQLVSDANEGEKRKVPKLVGYAENVVPRYLEEDFHAHFRLSNAVYKLIVERLDPHLSREHGGGIEQMSPNKQILIFLWYMANQDSMKEVSQQFGIGTSTVHNILKNVFKCFVSEFKHVG